MFCNEIANDHLSSEGLKYVAGYVAAKLNRRFPQLGDITSKVNPGSTIVSPWIQALSRGGLRQPSVDWYQTVQSLETEFQHYHGDGKRIRHDHGVIKRLVYKLSANHPLVPKEAITLFIKARTFIRMRYINRQSDSSKKRFVAKKMKKVLS